MVPALKLRLGLDQNCYDFLKWYMSRDSKKDWDSPKLLYLNLQGQDIFEELPPNKDSVWHDLNFTAALLLLKVRVALDLRSYQYTTIAVGPKLPRELFDGIITQMRINDTISRKFLAVHEPYLDLWITKLDRHIGMLLDALL